MRLSGLASGMDTETMIKDLMKAERMPLDKLNQKKTYLEWQLDDYRSVNRQLNDFSTLIFDGVLKESTYIKKSVSVSAPNDVSIRNVNSTTDFSGTIKVNELAKAATMFSARAVEFTEADLNKKLVEIKPTIQVPTSFKVQAINKDGKLDEGYVVNVKSDSTVQSIIDDINKNSGVNAFFDSHTRTMSFTAKNTGDVAGDSEIKIKGAFATFFFQLDTEESDIAAGAGHGSKGGNAEFVFNGLKTQRTTNTFQINGYEMTLKAANKQDITFSSAPDTEKILESVVKFVDEYNKLIEDLNKQIREPKYRDYQPLSTEQKSEMKEKEIELWEEKAKSGTLRNDSIITGLLNKMRSELQGAVAGKGSLADMGIKTSGNYLDHGKLIIDESKLREEINKDPNKIYEMFTADGKTDSQKGFARRIRETVDASRKEITARAGKADSTNAMFSLGRNLQSMNDQISRFEDRLKLVENRYWKQFNAMEKAIQRANSQSAYLANAFGGGQ